MSREHGTARGIGRKVALALVAAGIAGSVVAGTAFAAEPLVARSCDDSGVVARVCTQTRARAMLRDGTCDGTGPCANGGACDGTGPAGHMRGDATRGQARRQRVAAHDGSCRGGQCACRGGASA